MKKPRKRSKKDILIPAMVLAIVIAGSTLSFLLIRGGVFVGTANTVNPKSTVNFNPNSLVAPYHVLTPGYVQFRFTSSMKLGTYVITVQSCSEISCTVFAPTIFKTQWDTLPNNTLDSPVLNYPCESSSPFVLQVTLLYDGAAASSPFYFNGAC